MVLGFVLHGMLKTTIVIETLVNALRGVERPSDQTSESSVQNSFLIIRGGQPVPPNLLSARNAKTRKKNG